MIATFTYSLAGGMLTALATSRPEQISWKFLRLSALLAFAAAAVVTVWSLREDGPGGAGMRSLQVPAGMALTAGAVGAVLLAPFAGRSSRAYRWICGIGGLGGVTAACVSGAGALGQAGGTPLTLSLFLANQVVGALFLGSVTIAWIVGHAYLVATRMTIAPLRHFSNLLSWTVSARAAFLVASLACAWLASRDMEPPIAVRLASSWMILLLRVGIGVVAVGVFAYMVSDCVRRRATQSATGLLYFSSLFAYIGELAGQQLSAECGWPL